jgi:hypothetical protein
VDLNDVRLDHALRAAVADAPPTGIDLDRLIGAEQRRQRVMRAVGAVCAAAASVLLVTAVFGLSGRASTTGLGTVAAPGASHSNSSSPRPCPSLPATGEPRAYQSGAPSPKPVPESCGDATYRLDGALAQALRKYAPGVTFADTLQPSQPVRFLRANDHNLQYGAGLSVSTSATRGRAHVEVEPRTYGPQDEAGLSRQFGCGGRQSSDNTCVYRTYSDGTVVNGVTFSEPGGRTPIPGVQYQITVFRPDSTVVSLVVNNSYYEGTPDPDSVPKIGGKEPPLTVEQLIEIGRDPGLTLYP